MSSWPNSFELSSLATLDERLLHVFDIGPGEGEAIAVALPDRSGWLLVDGCTSGAGESGLVEILRKYRRSDEPILVYALTHPHLDHARGIVSLCENYGRDIRTVAVTPPWEERAAASLVTSRRNVARQVEKGLGALRKLSASKRVDLELGARLPLAGHVTAEVLSPPKSHSMKDPNEASAVIVVHYKKTRLLLGSDLPCGTASGPGWRAILAQEPAAGDALVLKIPHHGSQTSHEAGVFPRHDRQRAWAATPFNGHHLPELVDMTGLSWILERGRPVHLTAPPVSKHVQLPVPHPGRISLSGLRSRVAARPTGIPLLDGAVETTPRALHVRDSLWCFAADGEGAIVGRWRGGAALEVTP